MGIKDKIRNWLLSRYIDKLVKYLDGKKTVIGAINLLLWVCIYAVPAFTPHYSWITELATQIRDTLQSSGIDLDNELFNTGLGFTIVGLISKIIKLFGEGKNEQRRK